MGIMRWKPGCPCCCCYAVRPTDDTEMIDWRPSFTAAGQIDPAADGTFACRFNGRILDPTTGCYTYAYEADTATGNEFELYLPPSGIEGTWATTNNTPAQGAGGDTWNFVNGVWVPQYGTNSTLTLNNGETATDTRCNRCYASDYQTPTLTSLGVTLSDHPEQDEFEVTFSAGTVAGPCLWGAGTVTLSHCGRESAYLTGANQYGFEWSQNPAVVQSEFNKTTEAATGLCLSTDPGESGVGALYESVIPAYCWCLPLLYCGSYDVGGQTYHVRLVISACQDFYINDLSSDDYCIDNGQSLGPYSVLIYGTHLPGGFFIWRPGVGGFTLAYLNGACTLHPQVTAFSKV